MAILHLVTKGSPSVSFLVTQGLGDYSGTPPVVTFTMPGRMWVGIRIAF